MKMNTLNWASLPDVVGEMTIMKAAEQEYLELYRKSRETDRNFWIGKWMEILYKFGQVCPKWKNIIFGSKMLLKCSKLALKKGFEVFLAERELVPGFEDITGFWSKIVFY